MPKIEIKKAKPSKTEKTIKRQVKDDARKLASATEGNLSTDQIRVLRCCSSGRSVRMVQIKASVGLAPEQKYSGKFLSGIHDLCHRKFIRCTREEGSRAFLYTILEKRKMRRVRNELA
jgi:hypothetical protein